MPETITVQNAAKDLIAYLESNVPIMLTGPGGIGKSAVTGQAIGRLGWRYGKMFPALADMATFEGLPRECRDNGHAEFLPFGEFAQLIDAKEPYVCVLEDAGQAPLMIQGILMQMLDPNERRVNDHRISDHVRFVLTANRAKDKGGSVGFLQTLKSRMAVLTLRVDAREVIDFALDNGWNSLVPLFLSMHPELAHMDEASLDERQYPTPRQWERVAWQTDNKDRLSNFLAHVEGTIGEAAAAQYVAFVATADKIPDPDECMTRPSIFRTLEHWPDIQTLVLRVLAMRHRRYTAEQIADFKNAIAPEHAELFEDLLRDERTRANAKK